MTRTTLARIGKSKRSLSWCKSTATQSWPCGDRPRSRTALARLTGALRETEERYRDLIENVHDLICAHDLEGRILFANRASAELLGYSPGELTKKNIRDVLAPEVRDQFPAYLAAIKRDGAASGLMRVQTRNGERRTLEYRNSLRAAGRVQSIVRGVARDITERRRTEAALRKSQERLAFLLQASPAVIYTAKASGDFGATFVSENVTQKTGYDAREFIEDSGFWVSHLHPEDAPRVLADLERLLERGEMISEYRFRFKDGSYHWMQDAARTVRNAQGVPVEAVGCWLDVTEHKRTEQALRESERLMRLVTEHLPAMIAYFDDELRCRYANEHALIGTHAQIGHEIVSGIEFPWPVPEIILQHHERLDGSGYPRGLKDDDILFEARLLAIADVVEAMTAHRPYRSSFGIDAALDELMENRGRLYDPDAVDVCVTLFREKGFGFSRNWKPVCLHEEVS